MGVVLGLEAKKKSPIYLLSDTSAKEVVNLPVIEIQIKEQKVDLSSYEALIFTSKNSVSAIEKINPLWKKLPAFVIGEATAKKVIQLGGTVKYIAKSSYGDDFAHEIKNELKNKKILFPRAQKVLSSLEEILCSAGVLLDSKIVYKTGCAQALHVKSLEDDAIVIFTSPSTVKCFFNSFGWSKGNKAVCIGSQTAKALPKEILPFISKEQSIHACIALAKTLIKQN